MPLTDSRLLFSDRVLAAIPLMAAGQRVVRDAELPGFFVSVGSTTKTFMIRGDLRANGKRQSMRVKVGEFGKLQTREARAKAKRILGAITDRIDQRPMPPAVKVVVRPSMRRCTMPGRPIATATCVGRGPETARLPATPTISIGG